MKTILRIRSSKKQSSNPEQLNQKFLKAICKSKPDIDKVRTFLNQGANVNMKTTADNSLLHILVNKNNLELINLLVDHKADINAQNNSGDTPAHIALKWSNFGVIPLLLQYKPNLNIVNLHGNTLLHTVIFSNNEDLIKLLIKEGVNIDHKNYKGITPLYSALQNGRWGVAKLLIENGADLKVTDLHQNTLLHTVVQYDKLDIVKLLIEKEVDVNAQNDNGDTALHLKIKNLNSFVQGMAICIKEDFLDFLSLFENTDLNLNVKNHHQQSVLKFLCQEYVKLVNFSTKENPGTIIDQIFLSKFQAKIKIFIKKALEFGEDITEYENLMPELFVFERNTKSARKVAPTDDVSSDYTQMEIKTLDEQFEGQNLVFSAEAPVIPNNVTDLSGASDDL